MAGSGTCAAYVPAGTNPGIGGYDGGSYTRNSDGRTVRGVSMSEAMNFASNGGYYCCDSCGSASWF